MILYSESKCEPKVGKIIKLFGSWKKALIAAGLGDSLNKNTKEDCIKAIQEYYNETGMSGSVEYSLSLRKPSVGTIINRFGSWNSALVEAGIPLSRRPNLRGLTESQIRESCIKSLIKLKEEHGTTTLRKYIDANYYPPSSRIIRVFGTWNDALVAAGLIVKVEKIEVDFTTEGCLKALRNFHAETGKTNNRLYRKSNILPSYAYITKTLGSWNTTLLMVGIKPDKLKS